VPLSFKTFGQGAPVYDKGLQGSVMVITGRKKRPQIAEELGFIGELRTNPFIRPHGEITRRDGTENVMGDTELSWPLFGVRKDRDKTLKGHPSKSLRPGGTKHITTMAVKV
jgi:hypothetical protein